MKEVYAVYGIYDIIALVEGKTLEEVKRTVTSEIRNVRGYAQR